MVATINFNNIQTFLGIIGSKKKVLVGGCFDILHVGHIKFLEEAKKFGEILIVFLESDAKVKRIKGPNRPVFNQYERAKVLSSISFVDYVIMIPELKTDEEYDSLVSKIKPDIIAVTENDPIEAKKRKQAQSNNGKLVIIPHIKTYSSSRLAAILGIE